MEKLSCAIRILAFGAFLVTGPNTQAQAGTDAALQVPHSTAPIRLGCNDSSSYWNNIPRVTLSKRDLVDVPPDANAPPALDARTPISVVFLVSDPTKPASRLPSPVQNKLDSFQGNYAFQWDESKLYGYAEIKEQNLDSGHARVSKNEFDASPSQASSGDLFYSTLILDVGAPSWQRWVTEMHIHVRPPKAKPLNAMFFGRTNAEEDFKELTGEAVACPTSAGWIAKFSVAWLPYDEWKPATGATANIRLLIPLAYEHEGYVLASVVPIMLTK